MSDLHTNLIFPSNLENVSQIESFVDAVVTHYKLTPDVHGNMLVSLTEAVTNAVRHGNREDCNKHVSISLRFRNDALSIRVADEGPGFNPDTVPDPTCPEHLDQCGGRGLFLMRHLSDECRFMRGGSVVEMRFRLGCKGEH